MAHSLFIFSKKEKEIKIKDVKSEKESDVNNQSLAKSATLNQKKEVSSYQNLEE